MRVSVEDVQNDEVWEAVIRTLEATDCQDVITYINDASTLYYSPYLKCMKSSFSKKELFDIATHPSGGGGSHFYGPCFNIVPSSYHRVADMPLMCTVQIEAEPQGTWFLHKSDIKESDSYFDQLKIDLLKANQVCRAKGTPDHGIPKLCTSASDSAYRFMTCSSEKPDAVDSCMEVPHHLIDTYLRQGQSHKAQTWVIRTNSSVECEILEKQRKNPSFSHFKVWNPAFASCAKEKKIQIVDSPTIANANTTVKEVKGLIGDEEEETETETDAETGEKRKHSEEEGEGEEEVKKTLKQRMSDQLQKWKVTLRNQSPFKWLADKQRNETDATNVALYFALSIIAVVIVGVITLTAVFVAQKNKARKLATKMDQGQGQSPTMQVAMETEAEAEQESKRIQTTAGAMGTRDSFYQLEPAIPDVGGGGGDLSSEEEEEGEEEERDDVKSRPNGAAIDHIIASQNKHFHEAERATFTERDIKDRRMTVNSNSSNGNNVSNGYFFHRSPKTFSAELEKSLGFPPSASGGGIGTSAENQKSDNDTCTYPKRKTVTIALN